MVDSIITIVCIFGILCAFITIALNINLILKIVLKKSKRVEEMTLFYFRFVVDVFYAGVLLNYVIYVLLSIYYEDIMNSYRPLIVYLALPWSNFGACRSIIALSIAMDRVIAAYFPLKYRKYRPRFPNFLVLLFAIPFGLFQWPVLFGFCDYNMEIPPGCRVFGCSVNRCFYRYWSGHKVIIFSSIAILSVILSIKLFFLNHFKTNKKDQKLSKTNRLVLIGTVTVITFDFLPSFCGNIWPNFYLFDFSYVGPYNPVLKMVGCAIEAIIVTSILLPKTLVTVVASGRSKSKTSKVKPSEAKLSTMA